jgi:hypothetical protein
MTYNDVVFMLEEAELPLAYDHFAEGESPDPPFLLFLSPAADNFAADNTVYASFPEINVELYTDRKDPKLEARLEEIFKKHECFWEKTEAYIESERLYEVLYELTL